MMKRGKVIGGILLVLLALVTGGCEGTTFSSSVPAYPVHVTINTRGEFVTFQPENYGEYVTVDKEYYCLNGKPVRPCTQMDQCGYGGVVVFVSMNGYDAYDLACPYCAGRSYCRPCRITGSDALCDECGEEYSLGLGTATPQKGIAREALRRLEVVNTNGVLNIKQRR